MQEKRAKGGTYWQTIEKTASKEPFDLNDDTGTIRIQPDHADLILDEVVESSTLDLEQKKKLEEFGIKLTGFFGTPKKFQVCEYLISSDKEVSVNGEVQIKDGKKIIAGHLGDPVIISDSKEANLLKRYYQKIGYNLLWGILLATIYIGLRGK